MGQHRAPEESQNRWIRFYTVYCQPFYRRYRKSIVAAISTAITTIISVYTGGISTDEWVFILIQVGATLGVWGIPNATNKKVVKKDVNLP